MLDLQKLKTRIIPGLKIMGCLLLLFSVQIASFALYRARLIAPEPTPLVLDRQGRFLTQIEGEQGYGYWPVNELPERVVAATLALEDRHFWHHPGIDPLAMGRAFLQNISSGERISGASTITMQVARLQHPGRRTYLNKAIESLTAVFLTLRYGREAILKHYLRIVPYANNFYGIAYAARFYLDKPVEDLSWAEIAMLSSIPQSPSRMNPFRASHRPRILNRAARILEELRDNQVMPAREYELAQDQLQGLKFAKKNTRPLVALHAILRMEDALTRDRSWRKQGEVPLLVAGLDLKVQQDVQQDARQFLEKWRRYGADNTAVIVLDRTTREIVAYLGSNDYFSRNGGAIDYARILRSPGSALKPFIYALALDRGEMTSATILDDLPSVSRGFKNADSRYLGPLLPRQALATSRNIPAINLVQTIGIDETYMFFKNLGLHDEAHPSRYYGLNMAVGSLPVSLEQLVTAYGALANDGLLGPLEWFHNSKAAPEKRVLSEAAARQIALYLSDPIARLPVFSRLNALEYPFPVAVKTGTSQEYRNAWAAAWTQKYIVGVWTGGLYNQTMNGLGGSNSSAALVHQIVTGLHKHEADGLHDLAFPAPSDYTAAEICAYTGKVSSGNCLKTFREWFPEGALPEVDTQHKRVEVDTRNHLLATPWTPKQWVQQQNVIDLPPRYLRWATDHSIALLPKSYSQLDMPPQIALAGTLFDTAPQIMLSGQQHIALHVDSPKTGMRIIHDPGLPVSLNSIALRATADPMVEQLLWYVDGEPYKLADPPFTVRWTLEPGTHRFQVRAPYRRERSETVVITVE